MVQPAFSASDFTLTEGTPKKYTHVSQGSGKEIHIHFCDTCGTKVFQTFERFEGAVGVYAGTFDDPDWLQLTPDNAKHIFLSSAQRNTVLPGHIPLFMEHAIENDGTPASPVMLDAPRRRQDI